MRTVPLGWASAVLADVAQWSSGGTPSRANPSFFSGAIPWIKTGELGSQYLLRAEEHISQDAVDSSAAKVFPKGTVVLAMYGATIGKASILAFDASTNQACAAGFPDGVGSLFLHYFLLSQREEFVDAGKGGAQPNISQGIVKDWPILVPPRAEQTRIVDKLEELLSDLDAGVGELKAAQKKLAQYRQSLLKAAVEGRLTEAWRAQHGEPEESGTQLLTRILRERRARWEAKQLAKFESQGKMPARGWQARYPEPAPAAMTDLPELPKNWTWASVEQVASDHQYSLAIGPFGSNLKVPDYRKSGVPLVFVRNIRSSRYGGAFTKYISEEKALELRAHSVKAGDVLVTKMGEPPGDADVYPLDQPVAVITADCIKVSCCSAMMNAQFLAWTINSEIGRQQIRPMTQGVAQKKVSLGRFSQFAVPLAPFAEQLEVVEITSMALQDADDKQRTIVHALRQAAAQRKNILQSAFSGQLVPQDPNDEPASVLLARIRAERAARIDTAPKRGRKARALL